MMSEYFISIVFMLSIIFISMGDFNNKAVKPFYGEYQDIINDNLMTILEIEDNMYSASSDILTPIKSCEENELFTCYFADYGLWVAVPKNVKNLKGRIFNIGEINIEILRKKDIKCESGKGVLMLMESSGFVPEYSDKLYMRYVFNSCTGINLLMWGNYKKVEYVDGGYSSDDKFQPYGIYVSIPGTDQLH